MPGKLPLRFFLFAFASLLASFSFTSCSYSSCSSKGQDHSNKMIVSVRDQKMLLVSEGIPIKSYKISTSKFGVGDRPGSNYTPLGHMKVAKKIGDKAPLGCVFKKRRPTGEVVKPNAPGRDPIVTRIIWLTGTESRNRNAFKRGIYIHGTPEEKRLGRPASYGCIRMSSRDVSDLYKRINYGADVFIIRDSIKGQEPKMATAFLKNLPGNTNS